MLINKNFKIIFPYIVLFMGIVSFVMFYHFEYNNATKSLGRNTIRFHVRANSDTVVDQNLKMKVKNAVVDYIYNNTKNFSSIGDTSLFITQHNGRIKNVAQKVVDENGFDYTVTSTFGKDNFPKKTYGDVIYPKGEYTSYTINIGTGKGHNWWCVLYPRLCFTDSLHAVVKEEEMQQLSDVLTEAEYDSLLHEPSKWKFTFRWF